ncbi:hypothetical protein Bbelb_433410 [Branchiostoma belcheri]|nr:hypothetical protein Bbelb_433410 [Branchiostoma belcheri]
MASAVIKPGKTVHFGRETFVVIAKDRTIFRFSTTHGCFILSPFNPLRRLALFTLTHSYPFMGSTPANITALMLPCDETCRWTTRIRTVRDLTANQIMEILSPGTAGFGLSVPSRAPCSLVTRPHDGSSVLH